MLYFCYQGHGQKGRQDVDDFEYPFESDPKALSRGAKAAWIRWWPRSGRKGYLDRIEVWREDCSGGGTWSPSWVTVGMRGRWSRWCDVRGDGSVTFRDMRDYAE